MKVDFGYGVEMEPSTQEDIDYVEANFREGDRLEHESLDGGRTLLKVFEDCWTVRVKGMIVGYCGVAVPADMTPFGNERYLCYMSCENANKVKLTYVRKSRDVMRGIIERTDPSVEFFRSLPNVKYLGSVRWHERVLKMMRLGPVRYHGEEFVLFGISREDALK